MKSLTCLPEPPEDGEGSLNCNSRFPGPRNWLDTIAGSMSALRRLGMTTLLLVVVRFGLCAPDPTTVAKKPTAWRTQHEREILQEFSDLLAIPNLANDTPNIQRNAAIIRAMLEKRGLTTQLLTLDDAPPIVVGDLTVPNARRTIAFYAHYDGQPVDPAKWKSDPWKPVMRDRMGSDVDWRRAKAIDPEWRFYARSAGDDKAPIIAMLAALDALQASGDKPSVNLRFVFEGEEEAGSPHLAQYLSKYPKVLRPDAWILCDGPVHQSRRAELFFGARGTNRSRVNRLRAGQGFT